METTIRIPATIQLRRDLLTRLQKKANALHESIDSYIEKLLMDIEYSEPNSTTREAINEARSGKCAGTLNIKDFESFMSSVDGIE